MTFVSRYATWLPSLLLFSFCFHFRKRKKREYVEGKGTAFYFGRLSEEEEAELFIQERKKGKRDDGCWFLDWCSCSGKKLREPGHREWSGLSRPPLLMDPASSVCPAASSFCCYGGYYYFWWHADRKSTCVTGESWARRRRLPNTLAAVHRRERERVNVVYFAGSSVYFTRRTRSTFGLETPSPFRAETSVANVPKSPSATRIAPTLVGVCRPVRHTPHLLRVSVRPVSLKKRKKKANWRRWTVSWFHCDYSSLSFPYDV